MEHRYVKERGAFIIKMPKEVDHHSAQILRQETEQLLKKYPVRNLIFDFQNTVFMDSSGIGVILGRCRSIGFIGGKAVAIHLNPQIQKIFRLSGLYKMIEVEEELL